MTKSVDFLPPAPLLDKTHDAFNDLADLGAAWSESELQSQGAFDTNMGELLDNLIKITYHPNSRHCEEYLSLHEYRQRRSGVQLQVIEKEPWLPVMDQC